MLKTNLYKTIDGKMEEVSVSMKDATDLYIEDPLKVYPKGFFKKMIKLRGWQQDVGRKAALEWGVKSVVDFGCASGYYLEGFHEQGSEIKGYEYAYDNVKDLIPQHIKRFVIFGDAQENLVSDKFDMSFSIEVAEHILPEKSKVLVDNLCLSSDKYIIFSAAPPGQGGTGHINEKPFVEWEEMFANNGFYRSKSDTKKLREIFKTLPSRGPYVRLLGRQVVFFVKEVK
jgi:hypothetical protein